MIFESITDFQCRYTKSQKVFKGKGNFGVYLWTKVSASYEGPQYVIYKHYKRKVEGEFSRFVMSSEGVSLRALVPAIYFLSEKKRLMLLEYLPNAGRGVVFNKELAQQTAEAVFCFQFGAANFSSDDKYMRRSRFRETDSKTMRLESLANVARIDLKEACWEIFLDASARHEINNALGDEIVSHGDIGFSNMAVHHENATYPVRIFDFGLVRRLPLGAEFHHFARSSVMSSKASDFFDELIIRYAELIGRSSLRDIAALKASALIYAADRQLYRCNKALVRADGGRTMVLEKMAVSVRRLARRSLKAINYFRETK